VADLKLFRIAEGKAEELRGRSVALERHLQHVIESNMETFFGVRFLASEYSTGPKHRGRIDSLGIDDTGSPVIFEYKRSRDENVINQGLFYLDWLLDHQAEFKLLVMDRLGVEAAKQIDWTNPRLVCIAGDFTRYDEHAVQQNNHNIELVRYRDFGGELLALELLTAVSTTSPTHITTQATNGLSRTVAEPTVLDYLAKAPEPLKNLYSDLDARLLALGDDIQKTTRKNYFAYKRLKNFACVEVHPQSRALLVYLKVVPDAIELQFGFSRDVRGIGHFGTGSLELRLKDADDLAMAEALLFASYEVS
jgi:predicted transport protein